MGVGGGVVCGFGQKLSQEKKTCSDLDTPDRGIINRDEGKFELSHIFTTSSDPDIVIHTDKAYQDVWPN